MNDQVVSRRILLLIPYGGVGGMERLAVNLYRHYRSLGDEVRVIKFVGTPEDIIGFGSDEVSFSRLDLVEMSPTARMRFYASIPLRIAKVVREHEITHSIAFGDMANLFSSLSPSREFKVASIHALKSAEFASGGALNGLFRVAYRTTYARFARVVCISKAIRRDLLKNCGYGFPDRLEVVYNPHDLASIIEGAKEPLVQHETQLFTGRTVVFIGRISHQKALWHLVRAFHRVLDRGMQARLVFIGKGDPDLTTELQALVNSYGISANVTFLGTRANPYKYLAAADVLALSSHFEGTPNVIVEAIALGVPVVSSHCTDGVVEMMTASHTVEPEGVAPQRELEAGILTPALSGALGQITHETPLLPAEVALADALYKVLDSPRFRESVLHHREELLKKFEIGRSADSYLRARG